MGASGLKRSDTARCWVATVAWSKRWPDQIRAALSPALTEFAIAGRTGDPIEHPIKPGAPVKRDHLGVESVFGLGFDRFLLRRQCSGYIAHVPDSLERFFMPL